MSLSNQPKIALLIETSNAYARGILRGIEDYIRARGPWSVFLAEHGRGDRPPTWLSKWRGEGIIARIENQAIADALRKMRLPIVDVSAARLIPRLPWVETDNRAIAALAAEHFLERGFRHYAFCGDARFNWSREREEHFCGQIVEHGHSCARYASDSSDPASDAETGAIAVWLSRLPKPVAVFACYDARGQQVLDACRRRGLRVPEEVAVLGVDNDALLCDLSPPPLSSVIPNTRRTGWEAADLLAKMMSGTKAPGEAHLIPPLGITTRQSTDVAAAEDVHVGRAVRFIRENACRGITVSDVVAAAPLGRRQLERRFREFVGRTLREEITRVQIHHVKELLAGTDLTQAEIAYRAGFQHVEYLSVAFKRESGQTPSQFRAEHRPHGGRHRGPMSQTIN